MSQDAGQQKPEDRAQKAAREATAGGQQPDQTPGAPSPAQDREGFDQSKYPQQTLGRAGTSDPQAQGQAPNSHAKVQLFELQDAESKLRSIEDQIGRYPIQIDPSDGQQGERNDKQW